MRPVSARPLFEVCVDGVEAAIEAELGGGDRLELCAGLLEGGTTPSAGTLELALAKVALPIVVLVRPRRGGFVYSSAELDVIARDVDFARRAGAHGVAIGVLANERSIDVERTRELIAVARPMKVTFHRAFDAVEEPLRALETLIELGVDRVLTSGGAHSAEQGIAELAQLVDAADGRIEIVAAGGVRAHNAAAIARRARVPALHGTARATVRDPQAPKLALDARAMPAADEQLVTQAALVRAVKQALEGA